MAGDARPGDSPGELAPDDAAALAGQRYHALFDLSPLAMIVTDVYLKVVDANAAAVLLLDVQRRFLVGKPIVSYVEGRDRREVRTIAARISRYGSVEARIRIRRRSGVARDIAAHATRADGEIYWTLVDRTEDALAETRLWELNREIEERVIESSHELNAIVQHLPVGVVVLERRGRAIWSNARAAEVFGGGVPSVLPFGSTLSLDSPVRDEPIDVTFPDRTVHRFLVSTIPVEDDRTIVTFDDATDRYRMAVADAEFVENAAHQLRTPITAIASSVAALDAGARDDPKELERFLSHIGRESARMARLVEALLTLSAHQRGRAQPLVEVIPLARFVADIVESVAATDVAVHVVCDPGAAAVGDRELLAQALTNVIENAAAHASAEVRITARVEGATATIDVADDGVGVPLAVQHRIFERFYRDTTRRKGSGLGLAIAASATRAMRGRLDLLETQRGATFRLTVPGARSR